MIVHVPPFIYGENALLCFVTSVHVYSRRLDYFKRFCDRILEFMRQIQRKIN